MPNNKSTTAKFYEDILEIIENNNLNVTTVNQNDMVKLGNNLSFKVLFVDNNEPSNPNNASIIVQLEYGIQKYLFMRDAEKEVESKLLKEGTIEDIDVLKVRTSWLRYKHNRKSYKSSIARNPCDFCTRWKI